jgi:hypothetical protein
MIRPRVMELAEIDGRAHESPLGFNSLEIPDRPTTESKIVLDHRENRFDDDCSASEQGFGARCPLLEPLSLDCPVMLTYF